MKFLRINELVEALISKYRSNLAIVGWINHGEEKTLTVVFGNLSKYSVPLSFFETSGDGISPEFDKFRLIDCGHTLQFGSYEAASLVVKEFKNGSNSTVSK